jgi:putative hydrolase of the HAD superfamily
VKPRAVFFDMDDTLLDTSGGVDASWQAVAAEFAPRLGCEPEPLRAAIRKQLMEFWSNESAVEKEWRTRLHEARKHNVKLALRAQGLDVSFAQTISETYWDQQRSRMQLFGDAVETLECLRDGGFQLGLITNGPTDMQREKIARFQLEHYFQVIVIEGEFGHGKPSPKVFRHALKSVGRGAHEAWHVGDNLYADVAGAQAVGLHAAWIHRDRLELKDDAAAVPDRVLAHLPELCDALLDESAETGADDSLTEAPAGSPRGSGSNG